jgi:hypothetical protein
LQLSTDKKILGAAVLAVALIVLAILAAGRAQQVLLPSPVAAWVAIRLADDSAAVIGSVDMEAGTSFDLLAVLEAETWDGDRIYYTDAAELWMGESEIESAALRRWDRPEELRIRWFTVEGSIPYLKIADSSDLDRFRWLEIYRADWPSSWSVPGSISSARQTAGDRKREGMILDFGTQRFHVRVEFFGPTSQLRPTLRLKSPGAESLPENPERVSTAVAYLPEPLKAGSMVFGLSHLELVDPSSDPVLVRKIGKWSSHGIVYSRLFALRSRLSELGISWDDLVWEDADLLAEKLPWGEGGVGAGDFIRVGRRVVELYRDQGVVGRLDGNDLCLDYERAASVSSLDEIFTGDGLVEWTDPRSLDRAEGWGEAR